MNEKDTKLWRLMSRGYHFSIEYLGHEKFIYHLYRRGELMSQWFSYNGEDIDEVEARSMQDWRDRQLKSIITSSPNINIIKYS